MSRWNFTMIRSVCADIALITITCIVAMGMIILFLVVPLLQCRSHLCLGFSYTGGTIGLGVSWVLLRLWCLWHFLTEDSPRLRRNDEFFGDEQPSQYCHIRADPSFSNPSTEGEIAREAGSSKTSIGGLQYQPLVDNEIRLLSFVEQESSEGLISFALAHRPLHAAARTYTALSYCWGDGISTKRIMVNGKLIRVRLNLYSALLRLHALGHDVVWVDAICINQNDMRECGTQVLRMRSIYAEASVVIVWLGDANDNSVAEDYTNIPRIASLPLSAKLDTENTFELEAIGNQGSDAALPSLSKSRYWRRMWVIQEYAVALKLQILVGDSIIDADCIPSEALSGSEDNDPTAFNSLRAVLAIRAAYKRLEDKTLLGLLTMTKTSQCSRRHDRVFGILALAQDARSFLHEPNYETGETELSVAMTKNYLCKPASRLDLILLGSPFRNQSRVRDLPSWCPNYFQFDEVEGDMAVFHFVSTVLSQPYDSTRWSASGNSTSSLRFNGLKLCVSAVHIGVIDSLGWITSDGNTDRFPSRRTSGGCSTKTEQVYDPAKAIWNVWYNKTLIRHDWICGIGIAESKRHIKEVSLHSLTAARMYFLGRVFALRHSPGNSEDGQGWLSAWLNANQHFWFQDKTLQQHAENARPTPWTKRFWMMGRISSCKWEATPFLPSGLKCSDLLNVLLFSIWPRGLFKIRRLYEPLKDIARTGGRLMSLNLLGLETVIGLANANALVNDEVFLLPGCSLPVILRRQPDGEQYEIVGEAFIPGASEGQLWEHCETHSLDKVQIEIA